MKNLFPQMMEVPDARTLAGGIPYWVFAFFFFPAILTLATGSAQGEEYIVWIEIGYHIINFVVIILFFFPYLKDSFLILQINTKEVLCTAGLCAVIIVVLKVMILFLSLYCGNGLYSDAAFGSFHTSETDLLLFSTVVVGSQPLWGTLCFVLLAPITTSCLLYASIFAPMCERKPWLAYLLMAFMCLIKHLLMSFCLWPIEQEMAIFLVTLPVHLIACWSYQKTDTVWTPIVVHTLSNLTMSLLSLIIMGIL